MADAGEIGHFVATHAEGNTEAERERVLISRKFRPTIRICDRYPANFGGEGGGGNVLKENVIKSYLEHVRAHIPRYNNSAFSPNSTLHAALL